MIELKPCPFCGTKASATGVCVVKQGRISDALRAVRYYIKCFTCQCMTISYDEKDDAVKTWNKRIKSEDSNI